MKSVIVAMLDRKVGFGAVNVVQNTEIAKRQFGFAINDSGIPGYAPADFELYKVGFFDDKTGVVEPVTPIELICTGLEMISK